MILSSGGHDCSCATDALSQDTVNMPARVLFMQRCSERRPIINEQAALALTSQVSHLHFDFPEYYSLGNQQSVRLSGTRGAWQMTSWRCGASSLQFHDAHVCTSGATNLQSLRRAAVHLLRPKKTMLSGHNYAFKALLWSMREGALHLHSSGRSDEYLRPGA